MIHQNYIFANINGLGIPCRPKYVKFVSRKKYGYTVFKRILPNWSLKSESITRLLRFAFTKGYVC